MEMGRTFIGGSALQDSALLLVILGAVEREIMVAPCFSFCHLHLKGSGNPVEIKNNVILVSGMANPQLTKGYLNVLVAEANKRYYKRRP